MPYLKIKNVRTGKKLKKKYRIKKVIYNHKNELNKNRFNQDENSHKNRI